MAQNPRFTYHAAAADPAATVLPALTAALLDAMQQACALLESMAAVQDWQREPAEWSFRYLAAYLATMERECHLQRVQAVLAGDGPHLENYSYSGGDFACLDLHDSVQRWQQARQQLVALVGTLSNAQLAYAATHDTYGSLTLLDVLAEIVEQDQAHIRHIQQLIDDYIEEGFILVPTFAPYHGAA